MGQVPAASSTHQQRQLPVGIVGDGRMARHFRHYLELTGIPCLSWSRRIKAGMDVDVETALAACPTILILISDAAIEPFLRDRSRAFRHERRFLHFSGSLVTSESPGFHPLMAFGDILYGLPEYQTMPFICEKGGPAFSEVFPYLPNPHFLIAPEEKPLYHALCVLSGNFTTLLWQKFFRDLEGRFEIPREAAFPYLSRIAGNLLEDSERALTGPIARKDFETLDRNIRALSGDPFQPVFEAFTRLAGQARRST